MLGLAVTIERVIALCFVKVFPQSLVLILLSEVNGAVMRSILNLQGVVYSNSIVEGGTDPDGLKAYARLEVSRLERGLFLLDIVVAVAPLFGLGTVTTSVRLLQDSTAQASPPTTETLGKVYL